MGAPLILGTAGNAACDNKGLQMKITVNFDNGEQATIYGLTPMHFAEALMQFAWADKLDFQTAASIEDAVKEYNEKRIIS
jgi:hypothetical protein